MLRRTRTLCLFYLSFVFKTSVSTPKKKEVFPQNSDLSSLCLIVSFRSIFAPLHLCTFALLRTPTPFTLLHHSEPPSHTTSHSLILRQETISLLQNHTPQNHIGFTLRSPIFADLCRILGTSFWSPPRGSFQNWSPAFARPTRSVPPIPSPKPQSHTWHCTQHRISNIPQHRSPSLQPPLGP